MKDSKIRNVVYAYWNVLDKIRERGRAIDEFDMDDIVEMIQDELKEEWMDKNGHSINTETGLCSEHLAHCDPREVY